MDGDLIENIPVNNNDKLNIPLDLLQTHFNIPVNDIKNVASKVKPMLTESVKEYDPNEDKMPTWKFWTYQLLIIMFLFVIFGNDITSSLMLKSRVFLGSPTYVLAVRTFLFVVFYFILHHVFVK